MLLVVLLALCFCICGCLLLGIYGSDTEMCMCSFFKSDNILSVLISSLVVHQHSHSTFGIMLITEMVNGHLRFVSRQSITVPCKLGRVRWLWKRQTCGP